jgi:type II secretory pathway component PulJ
MNQKGFTILEAVMSLTILSFLLLGVYGVLHTGNIVYTKDSYLLEMQQQARSAMDRIVRDIREGSSPVITTINSSVDTLTFNTPSSTGAQYYLSGATLMRRPSTNGAAAPVASNISLLKFTDSSPVLEIRTQASKSLYDNTLTISFPLREKVRMRNE